MKDNDLFNAVANRIESEEKTYINISKELEGTTNEEDNKD